MSKSEEIAKWLKEKILIANEVSRHKLLLYINGQGKLHFLKRNEVLAVRNSSLIENVLFSFKNKNFTFWLCLAASSADVNAILFNIFYSEPITQLIRRFKTQV